MALDVNQYSKEITIEVDLDRSSDKILFSVNQGEQDSRLVWIGLKQYGKTYVIPDGVKAYLLFKKPDGTLAFTPEKVFGNSLEEHYNFIAMPMKAQMCQVAGDCTAQITLTKNVVDATTNTTIETALTTCVFKLRVNDSALGEVMSTNDFEFFWHVTDNAAKITDEIEQKLANNEFSATVAVGNVTVVEQADADVINTSTDPQHGIFDFKLPKGDKGDKGDAGVIVSLTNEQFAFQIINKNLYLVYNDGTTPPDATMNANGELLLGLN